MTEAIEHRVAVLEAQIKLIAEATGNDSLVRALRWAEIDTLNRLKHGVEPPD